MEFENKKIFLNVTQTINIPFQFNGRATQEVTNIEVSVGCGCTSAALRVNRSGIWVATTKLSAGDNFRVTGALNKLGSKGVSTKSVTVRALNIDPIKLVFTMSKV